MVDYWGYGEQSSMSVGVSIRTTVRSEITKLGKTASVYSYSSATKSENEEGDITITWGTATSIKVISSNNVRFSKLQEMMGIETKSTERVLIVRDDATIGIKDKITLDTTNYEVIELKDLDPIEDVTIAKRIVLARNKRYD